MNRTGSRPQTPHPPAPGGIRRVEGRAIPLGLANVDTDLIIPAAHLKTVSRQGLGAFAFEALRAEPGNLFDDPRFAGAPILIAGDNFGCGSSREHAAWALLDMGIRAVVASGFSDIFSGNAFKNGLIAATLSKAEVARLLEIAADRPVSVDLETMRVSAGGESFGFALDPFRRECLMRGLDEIGLTLASEPAIAAYESRSPLLGWKMKRPAGERRLGLRFGRSEDL
jgi:3-isopropylmalate/(R)-2-methylmalate dehydratase small subunit